MTKRKYLRHFFVNYDVCEIHDINHVNVIKICIININVLRHLLTKKNFCDQFFHSFKYRFIVDIFSCLINVTFEKIYEKYSSKFSVHR